MQSGYESQWVNQRQDMCYMDAANDIPYQRRDSLLGHRGSVTSGTYQMAQSRQEMPSTNVVYSRDHLDSAMYQDIDSAQSTATEDSMAIWQMANNSRCGPFSSTDFFGPPGDYVAARNLAARPYTAGFENGHSTNFDLDSSCNTASSPFHFPAPPIRSMSHCPSISEASSHVPHSLVSGEGMSRQGSVTDGSLIGGFEMMQVESCFSQDSSTHPPLVFEQDFDVSRWEAVGEELMGNHFDISGSDQEAAHYFTRHIGANVDDNIPRCDVDSFRDDLARTGDSVPQSHPMEPTPSYQSTFSSMSSSSSRSNVSSRHRQRSQKQLANGQKPIAAKKSQNNPTSTTRQKTTGSGPRPLQPVKTEPTDKEQIARSPYKRRKQTKLYCDRCNEFPDGFRGDHELRRHKGRAHNDRPESWICVEPPLSTYTERMPKHPLSTCKYCCQQKTYSIDYNAAAHLCRIHFDPRPRGRRPKGFQASTKPAPRDEYLTAWLKQHGWLKRVDTNSPELTDPPVATDAVPKVESSAPVDFVQEDIFEVEEFSPDEDDHLLNRDLGFNNVLHEADFSCDFQADGAYVGASWPVAKVMSL